MPDTDDYFNGTSTNHSLKYSDDADSLGIYYRQLADSKPLSSEEELELWKKMEQVSIQIRNILYRFAFLVQEYIKLFKYTSPEELGEDFFIPRSENLRYPIKEITQWCAALEKHAAQMESLKCNSSAAKLQKFSDKSVELLSQYPARINKLYEWQNVVNVYRTQFLSTELSDEEKAFLEEKLFMQKDDFLAAMENLDEAYKNLDTIRKQILTANLRLVVSIVQHFKRNTIQTGDLIQEGNLGLIRALERFDYRLGHRFATYATWWIKQAVSRNVAAQTRIIRIPAHMLSIISRINRTERTFIQENGHEPTIDEIAAILEMPRERINSIKKMSAQAISLHAPVSQDSSAPEIGQLLADDDDDNPVRQLAFRMLKKRLNEALGNLTEREQQIIRLRFGLAGNKVMTFVELSELFGLTKERIRQLEMRALRKLREPGVSNYFEDYFL